MKKVNTMHESSGTEPAEEASEHDGFSSPASSEYMVRGSSFVHGEASVHGGSVSTMMIHGRRALNMEAAHHASKQERVDEHLLHVERHHGQRAAEAISSSRAVHHTGRARSSVRAA
ncbi:hypothetical protein Dimus_010701, partial [Dionaea muscipula]